MKTVITDYSLQKSLVQYLLHLADNCLILAQRNSEWCGHGPVLEQDIALTNISLDLLGQARNFYQYAASVINNNAGGSGATEDTLAYNRDVRAYKNVLLVEQPNGDWGQTILRQCIFSHFQFLLYEALKQGADEHIAAIAEKGLKEITYHVKWSSEWVIRLGDGTLESHKRMVNAIAQLWDYTNELFQPSALEMQLAESNFAIDVSTLKHAWQQNIEEVLKQATLQVPSTFLFQQGGKTGNHSEHLGYILAEMQFLQKTYPNSNW